MNKNNKPKIRIAIIGSGFSATFHIENYKRVHGIDVEFAGIFSRDNQKAKDFATDDKAKEFAKDIKEEIMEKQPSGLMAKEIE